MPVSDVGDWKNFWVIRWSWWIWRSNSQHCSFPFEVQGYGSGVPWQWPSGLWKLLPLFNLAMIKWSPGEVVFLAQGCSISWEQSKDLSSAQRGTEFIWSNLPPSLGTLESHHLCLASIGNRSPLPPTVLDDSNYDKFFLALVPNPLSNNFIQRSFYLLGIPMSFLNLLIFTPSKQILNPRKTCSAKICW